ncbi:SoxR reducing system RseC family protein [Saccharicrinis sp. FJH54]|uniref:SoxR reducing system RseC family protein n=1 Tax=Saccharicrinis sp. FJH54 TaxID=3344665 RepID=UPI0035D50FB1
MVILANIYYICCHKLQSGDCKMHSETITHSGKVKEIKDTCVEVEIQTGSACGHCSASDQCVAADSGSRKISVENYSGPPLQVGDSVTLTGKNRDGLSAVFLAYFLPFILIIITLFTANTILNNEAVSGLISLGILVPYYGIIWLFKNRLKRKFSFKINS